MGVKTQKQLAAETLQEQHKSDLVGCILSGEEEPSDLVMFSALYLSVNMEMEVIRWKEKGGCGWIDDNENKITDSQKERNVGQREMVVKIAAKK